MRSHLKVWPHFVMLLVFVVAGSYSSSRLWGGKPEKLEADKRLSFSPEMTALDYVRVNDLPGPVLAAALGLRGREGLERPLDSFSSALCRHRPWCHLFCPFGLVGWLAERISVYRIRVNHETCVACDACSRVCPSTVMGAILRSNRVIPDCFACGDCQTVCPTRSISFSPGKRAMPPAGRWTTDRIPPQRPAIGMREAQREGQAGWADRSGVVSPTTS